MANIAIKAPFEFFTDKTGRPLAGGEIFIGLPNQDPEASPQLAWFDAAGTVAAPQPIPTNLGGYPCDASGNPMQIFTAGPYSILVKDGSGVHVFYQADSSAGFDGVRASDLAGENGSSMVGYVFREGDTPTNVHDKIARSWVDIMDFGAVGDGVTDDKAAFDAAAATGRSILLPAGDYNVPSGDYSEVRFYSFDGATCTNGSATIVDPLANSVPVGMEVDFPCAPDNLPFGWVHEDGQVLNRTVYPQLWAFAEASGNLVDEANKPANKLAFGRGNGSTTFSLPDRRGLVRASADDGAAIDSAFVLGKSVSREDQSGTGSTTRYAVATPAIRAFATPVNQGNIDIQALQNSVNDLQTDVDLKLYIADKRVCTAWVNFSGEALTGTYTQADLLITVSMTAHGLSAGSRVSLDFTSGTAVDGAFTVDTVPDANTFTVTAAASLTTSGNVTRQAYIRDSFNVSSITDNGTGLWAANFATPMDNANFCQVAINKQADDATSDGGYVKCYGATVNKIDLQIRSGGGSLRDDALINLHVFGGKE